MIWISFLLYLLDRKPGWKLTLVLLNYVPVIAKIVTLVFHHKKIVSNPKETTYRYVKSTLRSCLFLSVYVWAAFYSPCLLRRILGRETRAT